LLCGCLRRRLRAAAGNTCAAYRSSLDSLGTRTKKISRRVPQGVPRPRLYGNVFDCGRCTHPRRGRSHGCIPLSVIVPMSKRLTSLDRQRRTELLTLETPVNEYTDSATNYFRWAVICGLELFHIVLFNMSDHEHLATTMQTSISMGEERFDGALLECMHGDSDWDPRDITERVREYT
jgi:hypothetical protein